MSHYLIEALEAADKVQVIYSAEVIGGSQDRLAGVDPREES